eukprot:COSAG01_NODE_18997_length_1037_cov_1.536741_1_plen_74_part_10
MKACDEPAPPLSEPPARGLCCAGHRGGLPPAPCGNFQEGMQQQPGILQQPAEADSPSIGRRRFTAEVRRHAAQA